MVTEMDISGSDNLAREVRKRLDQLGLTRRELARRTGLSRQTIHNIENGYTVHFRPQTLSALDHALMWNVGTAAQLARGEMDHLSETERDTAVRNADVIRWHIVQRISSLSVDELERLIAMMDTANLAKVDRDNLILLVDSVGE